MSASRVAVVLVALVVASSAPEPARAATVRVERVSYKSEHRSDDVAFRAEAGESNDVTVTKDGSSVVVMDRVPVAPGQGCAAESATSVRCAVTATVITTFTVELGDGDDRVRASRGEGAHLLGGPGDDVLIGPDATTSFRGGTGNDRMVGGAGIDYFIGEPGSDTMLGGSPVPGLFDSDRVDYTTRRAPVHADLEGDRDDGAAGERDRIGADVDTLVGGSGPDVLIGGPGANSINGNDGRDTIVGGQGRDHLTGDGYVIDVPHSGDRIVGGPGADEITGGSGADWIAAGGGRDWVDAGPGGDRLRLRDRSQDVVECGHGRDVAHEDQRDFLLFCEVHERRLPARALPVMWRDAGRVLTLRMACPSGRLRRCDGRATLEANAPLNGPTQSFSLSPGSVGHVHVPLDGRTPELSLVEATLILSTNDAEGRVAQRRIALREILADAACCAFL